MTNALELKNVSVAIEGQIIVEDISFSLQQGDIGCLLGPSGCGKTTLLRGIAGFEKTVHGEVWIDNNCVAGRYRRVPIEKRRVGMVFQDYALFPHMTVYENIVFGLQKTRAQEQVRRGREVAELLNIADLLDKYPHRLSGGQQQRVALARAIAPRPHILLLDEPFASMDIELREQIAREVRSVLKQDHITAILVSHNQLEAFAMADVIGVMNAGRILQWDNAFRLYHQPVCAYVADFIGEGTFLEGKITGKERVETELGIIDGQGARELETGTPVSVLIRPDDIIHDDDSKLKAVVMDKAFRGAEFLYTLGLPSGARILSLVPSHHNHPPGESIGIRLELDHLVIFPKEV